MSWLGDFVSNPVKAISGTVSATVRNPFAIINPTTWLGTAAVSGSPQVANAVVGGEIAGATALVGSAGLRNGVNSFGGVMAGDTGIGDAVSFGSLEQQFQRFLTSAASHGGSSYTPEASGTHSLAAAPPDNGDGFNWNNAAPGIALAAVGVLIVVLASR